MNPVVTPTVLSQDLQPRERPTTQTDQLQALSKEKYLSLTTFRRDGRAVATPVWFAIDHDHLLVQTGSTTGKVKRIRHTPRSRSPPARGAAE